MSKCSEYFIKRITKCVKCGGDAYEDKVEKNPVLPYYGFKTMCLSEKCRWFVWEEYLNDEIWESVHEYSEWGFWSEWNCEFGAEVEDAREPKKEVA